MAKTTKMRQCRLASNGTITTAWLPDDKRLAVGKNVTLKDSDDPARLWEILYMGESHERKDIKTVWNVGGL